MSPQDAEKPKLDQHHGDGVARGTTRMEIFADAVFAISFTLPVVELHLPPSGADYGERLLALWPSYLGLFLTALVIGIYWALHHFAGAIYRTAGHWFSLATVLFLFAIGFIAFPTRAFAEPIADPTSRAAGGQFYALALSAAAITWWIKWRTGLARGEIDKRLDPAYVARLSRGFDIATAVAAVAVPLALWRWDAGLLVSGAVTLSYMRAPETPVYRGPSPPMDDA